MLAEQFFCSFLENIQRWNRTKKIRLETMINCYWCDFRITSASLQKQPSEVFLEISQNSQENNCARVSFLAKLQAWPATLLKKRLWHRCFLANFVKFLRTTFLQNTSRRLLLLLVQDFRGKNLLSTDHHFNSYVSKIN